MASSMTETPRLSARDWSTVLVIAAVQFVNILDFVVVMPMGPDLAKRLLFSEASLGYVGGAYTAAACVTGLLGAGFLDRFDRKRALCVAMLGLAIGTALGGVST